MRELVQRIANRLPMRPIYHEGGLYLKRYYVCTLFRYWRVYLHHFMLSDPDGLHNHPFRYSFSLILAGHYLERTRWGVKLVRWFNWIGPDKMHRVELENTPKGNYIAYDDWSTEPLTCWSLFVHSPRRTHWAFLRQMSNFMYGDRTKPDIVYMKVATDNPTPLSDWYLTAPTGAEWESWDDVQKDGYRMLIERRYQQNQ